MKPLLLAGLTAGCLACALSASGAERIVKEWDFTKASDTLGWAVGEPIKEFRVLDGALLATPGPNKPKLESPLFELTPSAWQYVEVEIKTDAGGDGLMYYSNTTEEPDHGFRPGLYASFGVKGDGRFHTCAIRPFWQKQDKITHIRLDPPGDNIAIRAVRIVDMNPAEATGDASWMFKDTSAGWQSLGSDDKLESTKWGIKITGDVNATVVSPPISVNSGEKHWASVRLMSDAAHPALLRWASTEADGLQTTTFMLKGDGKPHTYAIDLSKSRAWTGKALTLGITPSDSEQAHTITVQSVALDTKPSGPADLEITRFGLDNPVVRVGQKAKLIVEAKNTGGTDAGSVAVVVTLANRETQQTTTLPLKRIAKLAPGAVTRFEWEVDAKDEVERIAVCRVTGLDIDAGEKSFVLKFYPKLGKADAGTPTGAR